ncbi:MAG: HEAT repeat domain-containing protein [Candidatus Heimdallarchaeota archaeon]|nr:HEAT repeat domain-containing protein [Candidatus Heimdallarchaeota archaeon]MCK4877196.1 HEAT repeat domain-containing protein [Candidatus Heimdallarchaeota archaeon]
MLDEDNIKRLIESLKDEDPHLRIFTINSIVDNKDREKAIPVLIRLLYDDESSVRSRAAWALGKIGSLEAMNELLKLITDQNKDVRKSVIRALGDIQAFDAILEIVKALEDKDWEVRAETAVVLEYFGWVPSDRKEEILNLISKEKWEELLKLENLEIQQILVFLEDNDKDIRAKSAWVLGEIKASKSIQALFDLFMIDLNQEVKESSAQALSKIGGKEVVELLVIALHDQDWYIRKTAASALGNLQDPSSIEPLKRLLNDDNTFVKKTVEEVLKKFQEK